jgi:tetratricopeptide (TPR) repeat protein
MRLILGAGLALAVAAGCNPPPTDPGPSEAVKTGRERTVKQPNTPDSWLTLGQAYLDDDMYNDAYIVFKRAWAIDPKNPQALRGMAQSSLQLNSPEAALVWVQQALALDPRDGAALGLRGQIKLAQGDLAGAYADLMAASKLGPLALNDSMALTMVYMRQGHADQAVTEAEQTVRRFPTEAQAHHNYAMLLDKLGRGRDAEDEYRLAIKCDPKLLTDKLLLAEVLVRGNRELDDARTLALEVATKAEGDGTAAGVAARALYLKGDKQHSLQELTQVQRAHQGNTLIIYWIWDEAKALGDVDLENAAAQTLERIMQASARARQAAKAPAKP